MVLSAAGPVTPSMVFRMAGHRPVLRKIAAWQARHGASLMIFADGEPAVLVMAMRTGWRRRELCFAFGGPARRAMPGLMRLAQLTLARMRQDGFRTEIRIRHGDARAVRMAQLAGFVPERGEFWTYGGFDELDVRRGGPQKGGGSGRRGADAPAFDHFGGHAPDGDDPQEPARPQDPC